MTSTTIESNIREQVMRAAGSYALSHRSVVDGVLHHLSNGGKDAAAEFLRTAGHGGQVYLLDRITLPTEQAEASTEGFDKEQACSVIRAFLVDGGNHAGAEYDEDEVTALLVLAGLEDEAVIEPEVEDGSVSVDPTDSVESLLASIKGTLDGLVGFARQHGFRG